MAKSRSTSQLAAITGAAPDYGAKRVLALSEMLQGEPICTVAKKLGISRVTVWRWTKEPEFSAVLAELQADLTEEARKRLKSLAWSAVEELCNLSLDEDPKVRLGAVNSILDRCGLTGRTEDSSAMQETMEKLFGDGSGAFVQAKGLVLASIKRPA